MILTEEELKEIENANKSFEYGYTQACEHLGKIIESHRQLLSANAELSFKNNKFKDALTLIKHVQTSSWYEDANYMRTEATKALEELK